MYVYDVVRSTYDTTYIICNAADFAQFNFLLFDVKSGQRRNNARTQTRKQCKRNGNYGRRVAEISSFSPVVHISRLQF